MNLSEAIEIIESPNFSTTWPTPVKEKDAIKLLLEAGKRLRRYRPVTTHPILDLLHGETED